MALGDAWAYDEAKEERFWKDSSEMVGMEDDHLSYVDDGC